MGTYELDDELVKRIVTGNERQAGDAEALRIALRDQLPIPVPDMPGAVVRTTRGIAILADPGTDAPWVLHEGESFGDYFWCQSSGIGRVTKVLSVGVDI